MATRTWCDPCAISVPTGVDAVPNERRFTGIVDLGRVNARARMPITHVVAVAGARTSTRRQPTIVEN